LIFSYILFGLFFFFGGGGGYFQLFLVYLEK